jgi:hypothetical protein
MTCQWDSVGEAARPHDNRSSLAYSMSQAGWRHSHGHRRHTPTNQRLCAGWQMHSGSKAQAAIGTTGDRPWTALQSAQPAQRPAVANMIIASQLRAAPRRLRLQGSPPKVPCSVTGWPQAGIARPASALLPSRWAAARRCRQQRR